MMSRLKKIRTSSLFGGVLLTASVVLIASGSGCGKKDGPSDYDKLVASKQGAGDVLKAAGAKLQEKKYPIGTAWSVDLQGVQITNEILQNIKQLGNVSELNLSKSSITDEQLGVMYDLGLFTLLNRFDLSSTGITDSGMEKMKGFIFLSHLNLVGTKVTPAAAERFRQSCITDSKAKVKNTVVKLK
jgi:hypothetical protein